VTGGIASEAGRSVASRVKAWLYDAFEDKSDKNIYDALAAAGNLADSDIRKRVAELATQKKLPESQAEELANLLINPTALNALVVAGHLAVISPLAAVLGAAAKQRLTTRPSSTVTA
jgi:hypothetical protein